MLRVISEHGNENSENTKLLAALALGAMKHLGSASALVDEDIRMGWRMARVGDLALLEKPADRQLPRRIDCYRVDVEIDDGTKFKLDPARVLFSLRYVHNALPPDFELLLFDEPRLWLNAVTATLLGELNRSQPAFV
jgi:hypothetical protein